MDRLERAVRHMPVLAGIRRAAGADRPLRGHRLALCGPLTVERALQATTLVDLGADAAWCASGAETAEDVAELARRAGVPVHGWRAGSVRDRRRAARDVLRSWPRGPTLVLDEDAVLLTALHQECADLPVPLLALETMRGGVEALVRLGPLRLPVIHGGEWFGRDLVDGPHGTAQSLVGTIAAVSGRMVAGKVFVVAGYGRVGSGVAARARGLGARVVVTEVSATRALLAALDGFDVLPMASAASIGDVFCTVTGVPKVIRRSHLLAMHSGAVLVNGGHLPWEIDLDALYDMTVRWPRSPCGVEILRLSDGTELHLIAGGHPAHLVAGAGTAAEVADVTLASQVLALRLVLPEAATLSPGIHPLPPAIDENVATALATAMGIEFTAGERGAERFWAARRGLPRPHHNGLEDL
ncbi:adenosylhomocysteinase [Longimycelium tulufanense]|uniref:Adenosylhomocysteinase n=1 Tax=Longimycelium tulufanense TaxID=907463 RepID=A0A8J3C8D6_9PSEU|nr:adenosylhomocysteinase [Longimycelium tulufanense]